MSSGVLSPQKVARDGDKGPRRIIAIGDIHGCIHALETLLELIAPTHDDQIIVLGDFIDQGRDSAAVIDRLIALEATTNLTCLMGNHEEMFLAALESERALRVWEEAGGAATLISYRFGARISTVPDEHIAFVRRCQDFAESDRHFFVHARYEPDLPLAEQPAYALRWSLLEEPYPGPHMSGKTALCGHTEQRRGDILDLGHVICLDTFCHGHGWLSAMDVVSGEVWQVNRWGVPREARIVAAG
ncbi:Serine/threonine-protein phosphatase 1 [Planctomycetes bacterium Pan216]|uniref:Serine/threonine-protein phosphatase 1 n=1 Tax=Kolteria novifilia TaxID=2527975 RepID=A0A518B878_9BACT|nr:Serine/threonine-protein phosphatase 1 [Planctomycetes bacterium Pan216]